MTNNTSTGLNSCCKEGHNIVFLQEVYLAPHDTQSPNNVHHQGLEN